MALPSPQFSFLSLTAQLLHHPPCDGAPTPCSSGHFLQLTSQFVNVLLKMCYLEFSPVFEKRSQLGSAEGHCLITSSAQQSFNNVLLCWPFGVRQQAMGQNHKCSPARRGVTPGPSTSLLQETFESRSVRFKVNLFDFDLVLVLPVGQFFNSSPFLWARICIPPLWFLSQLFSHKQA